MNDDSPQAQPPERIYIIPDLHKLGSFYREWITDASPQRQGIKYVREDLPRAAADYKQGLLDALALAEDHWNKYRDNKAQCAVHIIDEIKKAVAATPRVETGLTVEAARDELRVMFPQRSLSVTASARPDEYCIAVAGEDGNEVFGHETLGECLTEVRAWAESRAEREGESK